MDDMNAPLILTCVNMHEDYNLAITKFCDHLIWT